MHILPIENGYLSSTTYWSSYLSSITYCRSSNLS
jgi:hypothetical protein